MDYLCRWPFPSVGVEEASVSDYGPQRHVTSRKRPFRTLGAEGWTLSASPSVLRNLVRAGRGRCQAYGPDIAQTYVARGDEEAPAAMRGWAVKLEAKPR